MKILVVLVFVPVLSAIGCRKAPESASGSHEYALAVTDRGFQPAVTVVPRGQAVTLVVTRKTDQTCAKEIVIPKLGTRRDLPLNQAVRIDIPAGAVTDTLTYVCGMDMLGGTIVAQ